MAEVLTPQQMQAVYNRGGDLLVSAAAGSGKTKVLVDRLLSYITDPVRPANIDDFLIITYTKAAAAELRGKIASKISQRISQEPHNRHLQKQLQRIYLAKISTVHSFCTDILREYAHISNVSGDFRVADENECTEIQEIAMQKVLDALYAQIGTDENFRALSDTQGLGRDDRQIPEIISKVYNSARCHLNPNQWLDDCVASLTKDLPEDAAETPWGSYLMADLHSYLTLQIRAMECCAELAENCADMQKPAVLLRGTLDQLRNLQNARTWDQVYHNKEVDYGRLTFSKNADPDIAEQIKAVREACKKGLEKKLRNFTDCNAQVLQDLRSITSATVGLVSAVKQFSRTYDKEKQIRRALDFGDLEHKVLDLLLGKDRTAPTRLAHEIGARFIEVMVDEYQDSNVVQDSIFRALTQKKHNCFMVGDVKQSIYQFRLADPGIFLEKYKNYAFVEDAQEGYGRKVLLSSNFRSASSVISAVNDVFYTCMSEPVGGLDYGPEESLREGIAHIENTEPEVELHCIDVASETYREEAQVVAQRISTLLDGTHFVRDAETLRCITPEDIVILLRSPGSMGSEFVIALEEYGIKCVTGGAYDLFHTEEVEVLLSILQVIENPLQDIPLVSVLTSRIFCFSADELAAIRSGKNHGSVYSALENSDSEKARAFLETLQTLRKEARLVSLSSLINQIFRLTKLDTIYSAMENGSNRIENIQDFCKLVTSFEGGSAPGLSRFLDHVQAIMQRGLPASGQTQESGAVTVMSIHKSKGLEFPVVFLCGLSRDFNRESTRAQVLCDNELGLGMSCVDKEKRVRYPSVAKRAIAAKMTAESISEEMRVLYVALTRARDRLIMTYASRYLDTDLGSIVKRMSVCDPVLLTSEVDCPGKWILLSALGRMESKALFDRVGSPENTADSDLPWDVRVSCIGEEVTVSAEEEPVRSGAEIDIDEIRSGLSFRYSYAPATVAPSKRTATQLKGRDKDMEAAESAQPMKTHFLWRKPSFASPGKHGTQYGNAIHCVMQHIRYDACDSLDSISDEIRRLTLAGFITGEQAQMIRTEDIFAFFQTQIGRQLRMHKHVVREFKFSILEDAKKHYADVEGERILLQGVVDCAMIDDDGVTVLDFKSDRVSEATLSDSAESYKRQILAYADALSRIYERPVKNALLYYFHVNQFVRVI